MVGWDGPYPPLLYAILKPEFGAVFDLPWQTQPSYLPRFPFRPESDRGIILRVQEEWRILAIQELSPHSNVVPWLPFRLCVIGTWQYLLKLGIDAKLTTPRWNELGFTFMVRGLPFEFIVEELEDQVLPEAAATKTIHFTKTSSRIMATGFFEHGDEEYVQLYGWLPDATRYKGKSPFNRLLSPNELR